MRDSKVAYIFGLALTTTLTITAMWLVGGPAAAMWTMVGIGLLLILISA
jgi:heme/copper-type cytochrome/quinol oxidase subunit 4